MSRYQVYRHALSDIKHINFPTAVHDESRLGGGRDYSSYNAKRQSIDLARNSDHPGDQFLAAVHDTWDATTPKENVDPVDLKPGETFETNGVKVRVTDDEDGNLTLEDHGELPDTPLEAMDRVPIDKGTRKLEEPEVPEADFADFGEEPKSPPVSESPPSGPHRSKETAGAGDFAKINDKPSGPHRPVDNARQLGMYASDDSPERREPWRMTRAEYMTGRAEPSRIAYDKDTSRWTVATPDGRKWGKWYDSRAEAEEALKRTGGHHAEVELALASGDPVPREVIAEYPDLENKFLDIRSEAEPAPEVDNTRQLGLYAKDAAGNAQEVGERPGQADLFNRGKFQQPAEAKTEPVKPQFDPKHTEAMFSEEGKPRYSVRPEEDKSSSELVKAIRAGEPVSTEEARRNPAVWKQFEKAYRESRVEPPDRTRRLLGLSKGHVFADYIQLQKKHPEYFPTPESVRRHVAYVVESPSEVLPGNRPDHKMLIRSNGGDKAVVVETELRGGKYRVRTAYILDPGQLKRMKAAMADQPGVPKPVPASTSRQAGKLHRGGGATSDALQVNPSSPLKKVEDGDAARNLTQPSSKDRIAQSSTSTDTIAPKSPPVKENPPSDEAKPRFSIRPAYEAGIPDDKKGSKAYLESARKQWVEKGTDSPFFKKWFGKSKVVDAEGKPLVVYHGASRPDRVGDKFDPKRATSGPMQYFTSDPEIAGSYSKGKPDTSLEAPEDYAGWFKYKPKGSRSAVNIDQAWYRLSSEERQRIAETLPHVTRENPDANTGDLVVSPDDYGLSYHSSNVRSYPSRNVRFVV